MSELPQEIRLNDEKQGKARVVLPMGHDLKAFCSYQSGR
jgi:hypothetical protein